MPDDTKAPRPKRPWRERSWWMLPSVRFKEFMREPEAVFWSFAFPLLLTIGLGIAFRSRPPERSRVAVVTDGSAATDSAAAAIASDTNILVLRLPADSARQSLRTGGVALVVVPKGAQNVAYEYDRTRPDSRTARLLADDALQRGRGRKDIVESADIQVKDRGSRYIDFVVPGLLGMNIMGGGIWGLGFTIVDARRKNLLKRLVATPMSRAEYLMSFMASRFVMLIVEVVLLLGAAAWLFDVPVRGSALELGGIIVLSAFAFGGLGLLIAARPRTIEGASGLMNLTMMPMWVFSGVFFSASNFPAVAQPFIRALPLTACIDALRASMLHGAGWGAIAPQLAILAVWTVGTFVLALRIFRWR